MIAELEKIDDKYTYKITKNEKVLLESKYLYSTKADAIRGFQRFNSAVKKEENIKFYDDEDGVSVVVESNRRILANIVDLSDIISTSIFIIKLSKERIYIKDENESKMYHFFENINTVNLTKPLRIIIEKENDEYLSSIDNLNLSAKGENLKEVIDEIKNDLFDTYTKLFIENKKMDKKGKATKEELLNYLEV